MGIRDTEIKSLLAISEMVNSLAELRRELEYQVRLVVIEVTKEEESGVLMSHFQKMEIRSNVIIQDCFSFGVRLAINATDNKDLDFSFMFWNYLYPDNFNISRNNDIINARGGEVSLIHKDGGATTASERTIISEFFPSKTVPLISMFVL